MQMRAQLAYTRRKLAYITSILDIETETMSVANLMALLDHLYAYPQDIEELMIE